jgi:winged helix-turn helix protein
VLLSAEGVGTNAIMRETGKSKTCVWRWQERFAAEAVDGLLRAHIRKRHRIVGQDRNENGNCERRCEGNDRRHPVEPRRRFRRNTLFVGELPKIAVWLEDAGPLASLHPFFKLQDYAPKQGRKHQGGQNLSDLKDDVPRVKAVDPRPSPRDRRRCRRALAIRGSPLCIKDPRARNPFESPILSNTRIVLPCGAPTLGSPLRQFGDWPHRQRPARGRFRRWSRVSWPGSGRLSVFGP